MAHISDNAVKSQAANPRLAKLEKLENQFEEIHQKISHLRKVILMIKEGKSEEGVTILLAAAH